MSGCLSINRSLWLTSPAWIGPIFQMTSLMFGLGFAIGPQVVEPFLGYYDLDFDDSANAKVNATSAPADEGIRPVPVVYAYLVVGGLNMVMAVILSLTSTWYGISTDQCSSVRAVVFQEDIVNEDVEVIPDASDASPKSVIELVKAESQPQKLDPFARPGSILVTLISVAFFMNAGRSIMFLALLYTYLYEYLGWSVQASTSLYSMFHLVRFLIGIVVVFVARWVSPTKLVIFDMASLLLSSILMLVALRQEDGGDNFTAAGVMVASLGDSNILPTLISLAEQSVLVIAPVMSLLVASYGASLMVIGTLSGTLLNFSVISYPSLLVALVLACILALAIYYGILRWLKNTGQWPE